MQGKSDLHSADPYVTVTYNGQTVLIMIEIFICYVNSLVQSYM